MKLTIVAGTRPNFVKIAPIIHAIQKFQYEKRIIEFRLVHTCQHYDKIMSSNFFTELQIPEPHINLDSGGGSQAEQTANIMIRFEKDLLENPADLVLVVGDVTSTMACAITAQKLCTKVAHVEAGIRSYDWTMPEEINRLITDSVTNYFFTTTQNAGENLMASGVKRDFIYFVGNTMIDTLLKNRSNFRKPSFWGSFGLRKKNYLVITLHRPAVVDFEERLKEIVNAILEYTRDKLIIFPVHPRTARVLYNLGIEHPRLHLIEPLSYLEFNYLVENSFAVITDSGGISEETTVLGIPCMTIRSNTERPETIEQGTNELLGTNPKSICTAMDKLFNGNWKTGNVPHLWDGKSSVRIVQKILDIHS